MTGGFVHSSSPLTSFHLSSPFLSILVMSFVPESIRSLIPSLVCVQCSFLHVRSRRYRMPSPRAYHGGTERRRDRRSVTRRRRRHPCSSDYYHLRLWMMWMSPCLMSFLVVWPMPPLLYCVISERVVHHVRLHRGIVEWRVTRDDRFLDHCIYIHFVRANIERFHQVSSVRAPQLHQVMSAMNEPMQEARHW